MPPDRNHRGPLVSRLLQAAMVAALLAGCAGGPVTTPPVTPGTSTRPREVTIIARDTVFSPSVIDLVPGETVLLHVLNGGLEVHEAVVGNQAVQDAWEAAEAAAPPAPPGATPAIKVPRGVDGLRIVVRSGELVDATWTAPGSAAEVGGLIVGCHIPGHYAKGMFVPVRVAAHAP
jgi:uncharacterized cupredoxin-like copper-binding protein